MKNLSLLEARNKILSKDISSTELTREFIDNIEKNSHINAFITKTFDIAIDQAIKSDKKIANNENLGKLEGLPVCIKDLFCTKDIKTTAGSRMLENFIPQYESTVSGKVLDEGAVLLGKTNMDEFAMGSSNLTSYFGAVINPISSKKNLVPGGSSGGSAAAVAGDLCLAAIGSDTGGSIRQPASFCGIVGLKPTYGMCSRYGMIAFASSLDQAGPLTKTVSDAALMLEVISGYDDKDATSVNIEKKDYLKNLNSNVKGLKIGILKECNENLSEDVRNSVDNCIKLLEENGATIIEYSMPSIKSALPAYYILAPAEASSNLARYDGVRYGYRAENINSISELYTKTRSEGFGYEVKRRILIGTYVLSSGYYDAYYLKAQKVRKIISNEFKQIFDNVDIIMTPSTPNAAFEIGNEPKNPIQMYLNDVFTVAVNLACLPGISVPFGSTKKENLPLGMQFIAPMFGEQNIFNVAKFIEENNSKSL